MERQTSTSAVSLRTRSDRDTARSHGRPTLNQGRRGKQGRSNAHLTLATVEPRMHTLVLTGELHHRSAHTLEAEIERACEEGITGITLDLRQLSYIDSIGVAVIAFRCGLCKRRGYDFAVVPGSPVVQRALEQAGVTGVHPVERDEIEERESSDERLVGAAHVRAIDPVLEGGRDERMA